MKCILSFLVIFSTFYSFSQEQQKDTLFIKYDSSLLAKHADPIEKYNYYLIKGTGNDGLTYLKEIKKYTNLKPNKVLCLKNVLKKSNSYYKKGKIVDSELANYLGKYLVFLKKEKEYIQVLVIQEIE